MSNERRLKNKTGEIVVTLVAFCIIRVKMYLIESFLNLLTLVTEHFHKVLRQM